MVRMPPRPVRKNNHTRTKPPKNRGDLDAVCERILHVAIRQVQRLAVADMQNPGCLFRLRTPLLFWLELLLLLLLVLSAAGPHLPTAAGARPLVVVLDDSFSMLAGTPDSPRQRAAEALLEDLRRTPRGSVRLVLAGDRPQLLGESAHRATEVEPLLTGWACQSPTARLDTAVVLALELGGDLATVLVLSDHAPDPPPEAGRVRWWAFGTARPNRAFVNASRTAGPPGSPAGWRSRRRR